MIPRPRQWPIRYDFYRWTMTQRSGGGWLGWALTVHWKLAQRFWALFWRGLT